MNWTKQWKTPSTTLLLLGTVACSAEPGNSNATRSASQSASGDYYYLRCNATGWGADATTRMTAGNEPNELTITYEVDEPWMVSNGDNCQVTRTDEPNGWGSEQAYLGASGGSVIEVPEQTTLTAGTGLNVRYPEQGEFTATLDVETGVLEFGSATERLPVVAYYLRPSDLPHREAYFDAMVEAMESIQAWYTEHAGVTFADPEYRTAVGDDLTTMRCGANPSTSCAENVGEYEVWGASVRDAVGGYPEEQVTVVFAQGGGGKAFANLRRRYAGHAVVGDWVLEPISGVAEPNAYNCEVADQDLFCQRNTAFGTVAHEIGHAFGVHHHLDGSPPSVMSQHWEWPEVGLLEHEAEILQVNPMLVSGIYDPSAPFLDFRNDDVMPTGASVTLTGSGLADVDRVEFVDAVQSAFERPSSTSETAVTVVIPDDIGPGYVRAYEGTEAGNAVPVNFE